LRVLSWQMVRAVKPHPWRAFLLRSGIGLLAGAHMTAIMPDYVLRILRSSGWVADVAGVFWLSRVTAKRPGLATGQGCSIVCHLGLRVALRLSRTRPLPD
jgi:hypothetical protein